MGFIERLQFTAGTTYALAEIIDNSIQWKLKDKDSKIDIILIERKPGWHLREILIFDNGQGMDKDTIETCLDFGGGKNHGTIEDGKLGKFGLGLPYSSCSQSPNYHVYSWQEGGEILHNYRDHAEYEPSDPVESNEVSTTKNLPKYFASIFPDVASYKSGTVVQWCDCDRLDVAQAKTLIKHINMKLGRIYRHYINNGNVKINFHVYRDYGDRLNRIDDLCQSIKIFDPMFLMKNTCLPGSFGNEPTNEPWGGKNGDGEESFVFMEEKENGVKVSHQFKLRFSLAKYNIQKPGGTKDGGGVEPGKTFYKKAKGISLVRAGRELKLDDFGFEYPNGNGAPEHRWWSVEVLFEPISDELLGVNANKLDARNFRYLSSDDYDEMEADGFVSPSVEIRHKLSKRIDTSIKEMYKELKKRSKGGRTLQKCPRCNKNTFGGGKCSECEYNSQECPIHKVQFDINGKCAACENIRILDMCVIHKVPLDQEGKCPRCPAINRALTADQKKELKHILGNYPEFEGNDNAIDRTIKWFLDSNRKHFLVFTDLNNPTTFLNHIPFQDQFTIIEVNTSHPYYENFMEKIVEEEDMETLTPLLLFIASWIDTELSDYSNSEVLARFRSKFGANLMDIISNWAPAAAK